MPAPGLEQYDSFVASSPQGTVFAESWWLDAVAGPGNWETGALIGTDGRMQAAWPTVTRRSRAGVVRVGAPLTPALGPLLPPREGRSARSREAELLDALLEQLGPYLHLEARCSPAFDYWTPLHWHGFGQTSHYTWRMEAPVDVEAAWLHAHERVRRNVRKAGKQGVAIVDGASGSLVEMMGETFSRQDLTGAAPDSAMVQRLVAAAVERQRGEVLEARDAGGRLHAAGLFVWDARSTWYLAGGADTALRSSGAMTALMWEAIRRSADRGTAFDFEGSMLRHVELFVRAFGGVPAAYSIVRHTPSSRWRRRVAIRRLARAVARLGR